MCQKTRHSIIKEFNNNVRETINFATDLDSGLLGIENWIDLVHLTDQAELFDRLRSIAERIKNINITK